MNKFSSSSGKRWPCYTLCSLTIALICAPVAQGQFMRSIWGPAIGEFTDAGNWGGESPGLPGNQADSGGGEATNAIIQGNVVSNLTSNFAAVNQFDVLIVRAGATLNISADADLNNSPFLVGQAGGEGTLNQTAGTVSATNLQMGDAPSIFNMTGGAMNLTGNLTTTAGNVSTITVDGSTAAINVGGVMNLTDQSVLNMLFGAGGITAITTDTLTLDPASSISINGALYTGGAGVIDLITFNTLTGGQQFGNVALSGFDSFESATLGYDTDSVFLTLVAPEEPAPPIVTPPVVPAIDFEAINQLVTSAIPMNQLLGQIAPQVQRVGTRGFNHRLFHLRNRVAADSLASNEQFRGRMREVSARRLYRMERDLNVSSTIKLAGHTAATYSDAKYTEAKLNDEHPLMPTVTQQAAGGIIAAPSIFSPPSLPALDRAGQRINHEFGGLFNDLSPYTSVDYGRYELDNLGGIPGVESQTYSVTAGVEHVVSPCLAIGVGWSHINNENTIENNFGSIDMEGNAVSGYASYFKNNFWTDFLYGYGSYDADISRNTLGSTVRASPKISAHSSTINLGYNIPCDDRFTHGPTFRADYTVGTIDGYTETGNARANTRFDDRDYESFITNLGWQLNWCHQTSWGAMRPQFRVGYSRENSDQAETVSGTLQNSPFPLIPAAQVANNVRGQEPGREWLEFGAGIGFDLHNNFSLIFDYQGRYFQESAILHYGSARANWRF